MTTMKRLLVCALTGAFLASLAGCGPTRSTQSIFNAYRAIKRAEVADANTNAPYELALAREYYNKAREEAGYSKYEVAESLAKKAENYAKRAAGEPVPTPDPTAVDPDEEMP